MSTNNNNNNQVQDQNQAITIINIQQKKENAKHVVEYCNARTKCDKSTLLKLIYAQYNLDFSQVHAAGQCNLFSTAQYKQKIIEPIMNNNTQLKQEQLTSSDVLACCKQLFINTKKNSIKLVIKIVIMILSLTVIVAYDCIKHKQQNDEIPVIIIPQIVQGLMWLTCLTIHVIGITRCNPKYVRVGICIGALNWLYSILVVIIYKSCDLALFDTENISFSFQIITVVTTFLGVITMKLENIYMKRLLVLLKQLDQSELNNKFYLF